MDDNDDDDDTDPGIVDVYDPNLVVQPMDESHMHNSIHGSPHPLKPQPLVKYPKPKFHKNR